MSNADQPNEPVASAGARPDPVRPPRAAPASGSLALALLLSLLAVGVSGYASWRQWQQMRGSAADSREMAALQRRVGALEATLSSVSGQSASLDQRLSDAAQVNRSLREELLSQDERTRNLEDAVAKLAEKSLSGHDATLLDETESLLRMANERYTLFHDAQGAAAAYALADQTLAAVNDGAFSGVRQSIDAEREALVRSQPASRVSALQQLTELRSGLAAWPLKPLDNPGSTPSQGVWARILHALAGVISVQRDHGAPLAVADARFARELTELDLAHAQAALLAYDGSAYAAALRRVQESLSTRFDDSAPAVRQARATLRQLAAVLPPAAPVQLGAALGELRNLRAVHALKQGVDGTAPAAAATAAGRARP
ncbi:MAG: uroporphyrinogen-III C-methyltransferase [Xanthomonadaceae bacterium]|nr:uroporphyrinogen-III C-methyltransferase [Xanthomonadaceae bacterium]MDE2306742.1 uroporphyrinogen-III C-methyltransferase [Xanthomonadaceae bacterium]